ncbi:fungal-specific transcription factor domain-containing protein [Mycena pura]|uniref:Fungal-specific transcription factor domain-containing protein n=1 Tax=Mycena pura TaxID=153505 RepID=A0AAD6Y6P8_9AGAR|nr:fungal-specific transcription factor domain-containing protein [Mycena pura]
MGRSPRQLPRNSSPHLAAGRSDLPAVSMNLAETVGDVSNLNPAFRIPYYAVLSVLQSIQLDHLEVTVISKLQRTNGQAEESDKPVFDESMATPSRPIQSCFQCRKRKIKCNRSYPCAPCILRGESDACREVDKSYDNSSKATAETIEDLLHRVSALEATVLKLSDASSASLESNRDEPSHLPSPRGSPPVTLTRQSPVCSALDAKATDEDAAMMLEDFAMGNRVNQTRVTEDLEAAPYSTIGRSQRLAITPHGSSVHLGVPDGHPLALLIDPSTNIMSRLLVPILPQAQTDSLIQFYFDRLDWYSKVLHRPSFIGEVSVRARLHGERTPTINKPSLSQSQVLMLNIFSRNFGAIRIGFLAVHYMVLCVALHLIEPINRTQLGLSFADASDLARRMYSAAQACLYYDEFIGSHSLEHLQCIILMGLYQQNLDESDTHWALMGAAIKIAQNLGISRLGSEGDGQSQQYPAAWRSVVQREVARRVWWLLVWDDWSHAAAHNLCYSIHPSQNHTGFPANINDDDLSDERPFAPQPAHTYTASPMTVQEMTFSLCRLRFVELYRQIIDNMLTPSGYSFVLDMDRKISGTILDLPAHFFGPGPTVKSFELTLALIMGETRRLRLHRPYLFRGYRERKYLPSRIQCVESATAILDYLKSDDEQSAILLRWWIVLFYGFAAAVVLFIDLCHQKADDRPDLEIRRVQLREALDLFKTAEHVSAVSRNATTLLQRLFEVEPAMPSKPSRKRGATDDEPFERVVKRLIIDASRQKTAPGPSGASPMSLPSSSGSPVNAMSSPLKDTTSISPPTSTSVSPIGYGAQLASGNDLFLSGALFRSEDMFAGPQLDEQTMAQISQLLYNDPYGFLDNGGGAAAVEDHVVHVLDEWLNIRQYALSGEGKGLDGQASNSMDNFFEFAPGRSISLKLVDGTTASYTIVKPFLPFTESATILARPTTGPNVVIKIHDPRITEGRARHRLPPWDLAVERRAAAAPLRSHGVLEEDDYLYDHLDRLKKDQNTDPDELAALWEEKFYRMAMRSYEKEVRAYDFLVDLQGSMIPRLYSCGVYVVDTGTRAIDIPVLVLEYVDGVKLGDAPPELARQASDSCLALVDIVAGFGARGFIHDDISNRNVLLSPRESPTRAVLIDFGGSAVRHHTIDDEVWDFTVSVIADANCLRRLFEKKGIKSLVL